MEEKKFDFSQEPGKNLTKRKIVNYGEPLISIITPYYNADKYIEQTAISIFNQTFPYWEWLIVNDGSTNTNTKSILKSIAQKDMRIRILNQQNAGPAAARYYGAREAKANIVFTLDADDLIDRTMLECGYFTLLTNPEATWAYSSTCTFGNRNFLYKPAFDTFKEKKENLLSIASFVRKDKFLEVKEYATLPKDVHEDWYMWLYLLSKGYKPVKMNFYGFWYRESTSGRLSTITKSKAKTKVAEEYISKIAKKVNKKVGAIQYPATDKYLYNSFPKILDIGKPPINVKNEKKRIMFLFPWSVIGGADIFNLNLIKFLKEADYEITVVTTEVKEYENRQEVEKYIDEYFDLNTFLSKEDWAGFIAYLIRSRNINLVFESNSYYGYYVIPWLKCNFPDVIFVDYLHAEDWSWRDGSYPRDSVAISRYLDKTYTCTNYLKQLMFDKMNRKIDNVDVAYIGTDVKDFDPDLILPDEERIKKMYKGKKVILFPCRIVYLKRPFFMVRVIEQMVKKHGDIICVVVGNGPALQEMIELVKAYKIEEFFDFVGEKKDLRTYYKIADVTIICSLTEGLTLTAYESLAMETPVVSSDVGGQKELINENCGKIIKKFQTVEEDLHNYDYDKEEIMLYAKAIEEIIFNKDYEKMSKYSRQRIVNQFSLDNMKHFMLTSFENLINNGTSVEKEICQNIEIVERYLVIFNELYKAHYFNSDENQEKSASKKLANRLWKYKTYRKFISFLQRTGAMKKLKKIGK